MQTTTFYFKIPNDQITTINKIKKILQDLNIENLYNDNTKKENESVNLSDLKPSCDDINLDNDGLSKEDEMKFRADLQRYYKGEMEFISEDELAMKLSKKGYMW